MWVWCGMCGGFVNGRRHLSGISWDIVLLFCRKMHTVQRQLAKRGQCPRFGAESARA